MGRQQSFKQYKSNEKPTRGVEPLQTSSAGWHLTARSRGHLETIVQQSEILLEVGFLFLKIYDGNPIVFDYSPVRCGSASVKSQSSVER